MRADRMISILLMMQDRGTVTAPEIAEELEVSVRTARRDLEALGQSGLPVYSRAGRGGGWSLLGDGRTDLSGLSTHEASALFALLLNRALVSDTTTETESAVRKLASALPTPVRESAIRAAATTRFVDGGWTGRPFADQAPTQVRPGGQTDTTHHLELVRAAIQSECRTDLTYRDRVGEESTRRVDPLGLVNKSRRWYLVAGTDVGQRTFRLDRITHLSPTDEPIRYPPGFDLDSAWTEVELAVNAMRLSTTAEVTIEESAIGRARFVFGERLSLGELPHDDNPAERFGARRVSATLRGGSVAELAILLAGFHPDVFVIGPPELRRRLATIGSELAAAHATVTDMSD